jgi:hypothetical protein
MTKENIHLRRLAYGSLWISIAAAVVVVLVVGFGGLLDGLAMILLFAAAFGMKYAVGWLVEKAVKQCSK